jgi:phosphatidate phosphatase APP1
LSVVFADGSGERVTVVTDAEGGFLVEVPVAPGERGGEREIVVQSPDGTAASTAVEVIEQYGSMIGMPGFGLGG